MTGVLSVSHSQHKAREKKALLPHCHSHGSDHSDDDAASEADYSVQSILDITRSRTGWLVAFCVGLLLAAVVVEQVGVCGSCVLLNTRNWGLLLQAVCIDNSWLCGCQPQCHPRFS